ncbi:MAG: HD domain-containing protein [Caulobacteraceae bacterium]
MTHAEAPMSRYADALAFAANAHRGQVRKGGTVPYITHPVAVSALVARHGGDEDQMVAALLHDVLEDCAGVTAEGIEADFGARVLSIVQGCTDGREADEGADGEDGDAKDRWRVRKRAYLEHIASASEDVVLVSACDKLHNARCIVEDLEAGEPVFERFIAGRDGALWYYASLARALRPRLIERPALSSALTAAVARMLRISGAAG